MRKIIPLLLLMALPWMASSQMLKLQLSKSHIRKLAASIKTDTLFVVITNEKEPADAALVNAMKNYWTMGKYKFISSNE
jgi:hypothetical protein